MGLNIGKLFEGLELSKLILWKHIQSRPTFGTSSNAAASTDLRSGPACLQPCWSVLHCLWRAPLNSQLLHKIRKTEEKPVLIAKVFTFLLSLQFNSNMKIVEKSFNSQLHTPVVPWTNSFPALQTHSSSCADANAPSSPGHILDGRVQVTPTAPSPDVIKN